MKYYRGKNGNTKTKEQWMNYFWGKDHLEFNTWENTNLQTQPKDAWERIVRVLGLEETYSFDGVF